MVKTVFFLIMTLTAPILTAAGTDIEIKIPSPAEEASYIWRTIKDMPFFIKNRYKVSLPDSPVIDRLKQKSLQGTFSSTDYKSILDLMNSGIYKKSDYSAGFRTINAGIPVLRSMIRRFIQLPKKWDFKSFNKYTITLTLYGPGGSYNHKKGSVLIYTTPEGKFKQYADPLNTLIHELVHIGIEDSLIQKHKIPHSMKERIVDKLVYTCFGKELPDYRVQDMGDRRIDPYLQKTSDIENLETNLIKLTNPSEQQ